MTGYLVLSIAGIMLLIGMFCRAKIKFLQNMLIPSAVIAGVIGLAFMNILDHFAVDITVTAADFSAIINPIFITSFISLTMVDSADAKGHSKDILRGALAIGLIWCLLFTVTPLVCGLIAKAFEGSFGIAPIYGMLIEFAFCMGPGQSMTYGGIVEGYGFENAIMVALTFASCGFMVAYIVGIPAAKTGIKRGIAKYNKKIDDVVLRGYYNEDEQTETMNKHTTHNANIETLAFHFAIIGLCYVMAIGISKILALLPGYIGTSMSSLMFLNGLYAALIVKAVMKKLGLYHFIDREIQNKITGTASDFVIVVSFMSISLKVVSKWLVPILVMSVVCAVVSAAICYFFGRRIGSTDDFEKMLGLFGMGTGTAPSGISLIRIADPDFKTTAAVELGLSNPVCNIANIPTYLLILGYAAGNFSFGTTIGGLAGICVALVILLKITRCWTSTKTFSLR